MIKQQQITLYHYWRSSCSWRVRWALLHKGLQFNDVPINLLNDEQNSPSYRAKNPGGYVPAISIDSRFFGESMAIMEWIDEAYPHRPLLPQNLADRLKVRMICQMIVSGIQPIQNLSVMRKISTDQSKQAAWAKHWITKGLDKVENAINTDAGTFCFGGQITMADLCLVPQIYNAHRYGVDMSMFPTLSRINANCLKVPECDASAPHNQKGATT